MLRYALRRILWAVPTIFGMSLVVFFLTTLIPDPFESPSEGGASVLGGELAMDERLEEARRARFLDLPRFFNPNPKDARARTEEEVDHVAADDGARSMAEHHLVHLGGAALPYVLPRLETFPPDARGRIALALAPIAIRMGLGSELDFETPGKAILFWTRFWEDRALDFTEPAVRRAVTRLIGHGSPLREQQLIQVDTFGLGEVVAAMRTTKDRVALARLARVAAHVSERGPQIPETADETTMRKATADWQEWWYVHESDYVAFDGPGRVVAAIGETRYGKWMRRATSGQLGVSSRDGEPISHKLKHRAPVTLLVSILAMLTSYALAIPIGVVGAWRRGKPIDLVSAGVLFAAYSLPTFWTAELLWRAFLGSSLLAGSEATAITPSRLVLPIVALTLSSLASLSRYQRTAMLDVLGQDYIRTARAKGVPRARILFVHALRNALLPTVTLAGLQLPWILGSAFVVEEIFELPGIGYETLRAVEAHDVSWLMATIVSAALLTTIGLIASDVAYASLDPRVREALAKQKGAPA